MEGICPRLELDAALLHGDGLRALGALVLEKRRCASWLQSAKSHEMATGEETDLSATVWVKLPNVIPLLRPNRESRSAEKLRASMLGKCE